MPPHPDRVRRNYMSDEDSDICQLCGETISNTKTHQVVRMQVNNYYNLIVDCYKVGKSRMMGPFEDA